MKNAKCVWNVGISAVYYTEPDAWLFLPLSHVILYLQVRHSGFPVLYLNVFCLLIFASHQTEEVAAQQEEGVPGKKKRKKKKKKAKGAGEDADELESEEQIIYQEPPKFEVNKNCFCILIQLKK